MQASLKKVEKCYTATFHVHLQHTIEQVWKALTENEQLKEWMPNLQAEDLRTGGSLSFHMLDGTGTILPLTIIAYKEQAILEFEWGTDAVKFVLEECVDGCMLTLKETIHTLTEHTAKDLSGWHMCLIRMSSLLEGKPSGFQPDKWEEWHSIYRKEIKELS
ncbi:SRPBCC family protein [Bacillus sp. 1P06AnD]|uniref:SRPBCC family protein n=1 Tax=Bacillus sp. 1P06AnD TaxID=3132208 RepID=UPI00399FDE70